MWWFLLLFYADFWERWNTGFICKTDVMKIYHQYIGDADHNVNTEGCVNNLDLWWKSRLCGDSSSFCRPVTTSQIPTPRLFSSTSTGAHVCSPITLATNYVAVGEGKSNYHQLSPIWSCSWGGSPSGQASNFRQLAEEDGFLLVSATNLNQTMSK